MALTLFIQINQIGSDNIYYTCMDNLETYYFF